MISNERSWPSTHKPPSYSRPAFKRPVHPHPASRENTLKSGEIQIERKNFFLMLKENARGRFLRITEDVGGRTNSIIVPEHGLGEFQKVLAELVNAANEIPAAQPSPPAPLP